MILGLVDREVGDVTYNKYVVERRLGARNSLNVDCGIVLVGSDIEA